MSGKRWPLFSGSNATSLDGESVELAMSEIKGKLSTLRSRINLLLLLGAVPAAVLILYHYGERQQGQISIIKDQLLNIVRLAAKDQKSSWTALGNCSRHLATALIFRGSIQLFASNYLLDFYAVISGMRTLAWSTTRVTASAAP